MDGIEFVDLQDELVKNNIAWHTPVCCNSGMSNYSMLRVQMQGQFFFNRHGVWIENPEHDKKCLDLLRLAARRNHDLVLFPEYCISYSVLQRIIADEQLRPKNQKLWVLPCQGITVDEFQEFMHRASADENIFLLDKAWISDGTNQRAFVTALFYCFLGKRDGKTVLCLVPQLKTQPMGDRNCLCEQAGMSTSNVIFTLEHRLLTLLCADSMNNDITWQAFQKDNLLMPGLTILHPQLNPHPKDRVFSRLRWELFEHADSGNYITCNWAKGTALYQERCPDKPAETIDISWSCFYRKHSDDIYDKWCTKDSLRRENGKHWLFGALMRLRRTEVWFSLGHEEALELNIPMSSFSGYGKVHLPDIHAQELFCYDSDAKCWKECVEPLGTLQERIDATCPKDNLLCTFSKAVKEPYRFPLDIPSKFDSDQFFALALADFRNNVLEIDERENLSAWTLLSDNADIDAATDALDLLLSLIAVFDTELPPQCVPLKAPHSFCYQPAQNGKPSINFRTEEKNALVAYAQSTLKAQKHVQFLRKEECYDNEDLLRQFVRVFYRDPVQQKVACEPKFSTDITQGNAVSLKGDITNGGSESDP